MGMNFCWNIAGVIESECDEVEDGKGRLCQALKLHPCLYIYKVKDKGKKKWFNGKFERAK